MQTQNNLPPQNIEAEQAIISACLISPDAMIEANDFIKPLHFYRTAHQKIFESMADIHSKDVAVDIVTVVEDLKNKGRLEEIGGAYYLSKIIDTVPMAVNVEHYCNIVKSCAVKRQLLEQCNAIFKRCFESANGVVDLLDDAQKRISSISIDTKDNVKKISDTVLSSVERYEDTANSTKMITGVPTGFSFLDLLTCGWQKSDLIILAARPSMGKTALAWGFAEHAAENGYPALIFSLEMSDSQLIDRAMSKQSRVNTQKFRSGKFDYEDWPKITEASSHLYDLPIWIDDTPAVDHHYIRRVSRIYAIRHKIQLVVIDHLQLMRGDKSPTRDREIASITGGLKAMAKELNIPVILLSQLNRALEQRSLSDRKPRLSDLRDSGNIEQDADIVSFLYREGFYDADCVNPNIAELNIQKHRNGPTGTVELWWNPRITTFFEVDKNRENNNPR